MRVRGLRHGEAKLHAHARLDRLAVAAVEVRETTDALVAILRAICADRARHPRQTDLRIGIRQLEVVLVASEVPVHGARLAASKEVRLLQADEAADAQSLAGRGTEVHVAGLLFLDAENDVHVAAGIRTRVGIRHRRLEESEVRNVLIGADEAILIEHVARHDQQRVPDAAFDGVIVAKNFDTIHDRRLAFLDLPAQVRDVFSIRRITIDNRTHVGIDVALVAVRGLHLARPFFPATLIKGVRRQ